MARHLVVLAVLAGCGGGKGDTTDSDTVPSIPEDTSRPAEDSGPTESFSNDATYFFVVARFAFDAATGNHVDYAVEDQGLQPLEFEVVIVDSDGYTACSVTLSFEGPLGIADWVEPHAQWTGFDVPRTATVHDGCAADRLPSEFGGDVGAAVARWDWAVGVGPIDPYIEDYLAANLPPSEWDALEPYAVGAALLAPILGGSATATAYGFSTDGYALGYEVDGNFQIEVGGTGAYTPISKDLVNQPVGVATGYYEVTLGAWGPATALAAAPP